MHRRPQRPSGGPVDLLERFKEIADQAVEIGAATAQFFNPFYRVNDSGVVFSTEAPADLRQRRLSEHFTEVHGDLTRHGD